MFRHIGYLLVFVLGASAITSCGRPTPPTSPEPRLFNARPQAQTAQIEQSTILQLNASRAAQGLASSPVQPQYSFSSANGKELTKSDIDNYIDPDITGNDRVLAEQLMSTQQIYSRGDFVLLGGDGHVVSNRDVLRNAFSTQLEPAGDEPSRDVAIARRMTYPPIQNAFQGGPFYREYNALGITAAFAFVTIPCDDELFLSGDSGDVYFGENGPSNGQTEGGLQVTDSPPMALEPPSIQIYGRSTSSAYSNTNGYVSIRNPVHYQCGQPLTMEYGQLAAAIQGQTYFFAMAGIPEYSPTQYIIPGDMIKSTNVSYVYALVPNDFNWPGIDHTSTPTPCSQCYLRRMDSIAQRVYNPYSGECFGMCKGYISIRWDQIYMGQMTKYANTPVGDNGFLITNTFKVSDEPWYGGVQKFPDSYRVQSSTANLPAGTINWDYEGLNLASNMPHEMQAVGAYNTLQAVPAPESRPVQPVGERTGQ